MGWIITKPESQFAWINGGEESTMTSKRIFSYQENDVICLEIEITESRLTEDYSRCDEPDFRLNVLIERTAKIKAYNIKSANLFNLKLEGQNLPPLTEDDCLIAEEKVVWEKEYACVSEPEKFQALFNAMHQFSSLDNKEMLDTIQSYVCIPTIVCGQGIVKEIWADVDTTTNEDEQRELRKVVMQNFIEGIKPRVPSLFALCQAKLFSTNNNNNNHNNSNNNDLSEDLQQDKKRKFG